MSNMRVYRRKLRKFPLIPRIDSYAASNRRESVRVFVDKASRKNDVKLLNGNHYVDKVKGQM